jgi:cytochrome c-type biogenesis protein CcmF
VVNPLVNWIWLGFGVLALGTGIALLPERAFNYALARLPPEASIPAAAAPLILLLLLVPTTSAFAQEAGLLPHEQLEQTVLLVPKTELEKDLHRSIICMCGTCGRKNLAECTCSEAARMRSEIAGLVSQGKSRDEIVQYHIDKYGSQEPLAAPLDRGFNRLAWLLPYALGAGGLVVAALAAVRWSRHAAAASRRGDEATESSPELEARLDDELSQLD